jgi:hypothetical protein
MTKLKFSSKKGALIAALQAGAARDFAILKAARRLKPSKSEKKSYKPGTLGTSVVATTIKEMYGNILGRKLRKQISGFEPCYNGNGPVRIQHNIKPNKYGKKSRRRTSTKSKGA